MPATIPLTGQALSRYLLEETDLFPSAQTLQVTELSDGNINYVFRAFDRESGRSVIVKQAMPYMRIFPDSWPLDPRRAVMEAECLSVHRTACPDRTVALLGFDRARSLLILEDLSSGSLVRETLCRGNLPVAGLGKAIGDYVARTSFRTSDFFLSNEEKQELFQSFDLLELRMITEEVFFSDPYWDCERNNFCEENREQVSALWSDEAVLSRVGELHLSFLTKQQSLIHGDLHTGSVFQGADFCKVIDHEFCSPGPIAFDLGVFVANLLLHCCARIGLSQEREERREFCNTLLREALETLSMFAEVFPSLVVEEARAVRRPIFVHSFTGEVVRESLGFAGVEMIRRTIGIGHVKDLEIIVEREDRVRADYVSVEIARFLLLLSADRVAPLEQLFSRIRDFVLEQIGIESSARRAAS